MSETPIQSQSGQADKARILRQRARVLAQEPPALQSREIIQVVEFLLSGERYAFESTEVREVYPLRDLTPLPCTPAFVLGIINLRGQILAIIDLRRFFDLPIRGLTDLNKVVVLSSPEMKVGVLADAVLGVRDVALDELQPALPTMTEVGAEFLRGLTPDRLIVLNAERILADSKILVNEQVQG